MSDASAGSEFSLLLSNAAFSIDTPEKGLCTYIYSVYILSYAGPYETGLQYLKTYLKFIDFLFLKQNMCCGYSI